MIYVNLLDNSVSDEKGNTGAQIKSGRDLEE